MRPARRFRQHRVAETVLGARRSRAGANYSPHPCGSSFAGAQGRLRRSNRQSCRFSRPSMASDMRALLARSVARRGVVQGREKGSASTAAILGLNSRRSLPTAIAYSPSAHDRHALCLRRGNSKLASNSSTTEWQPLKAFHTDRHHASIIRSRSTPGVAARTSATVTSPRCSGSGNTGHGRFTLAMA